jgi:hypothetical protein
VRFEITNVLDAIERHLTTEAALAQAVIDLGEIAWFDALDGGRTVNLLRAGMALDALARHLGEDAVMVYPVASRDLLTDADLTSKERMVLGRWAGDGLIEVVGTMADRVPEVADITGLPLVARGSYPGLEVRYPWLRTQPDRLLRLIPAEGGARLHGPPLGPPAPGPGAMLLGRVWRCVRRDCPQFGERRLSTQAVPRMKAGVPVCPRHDEPLTNIGSKPPSVTMVLAVDGTVCDRFVLRSGRPVTVGRSPDDPDDIMIGQHLPMEIAPMVSRNHVRLDLRDDGVYLTDVSTNGTVVRSRTSPFSAADEVLLTGGPAYQLKPWDTVELHDRIVIARAGQPLNRGGGGSSVMGDAPTIAMRPPLP